MQATLSHYRILEQIGAGGMGVVYRAHDERLDRDVALKVLPTSTKIESDARKRFRKEALLLSKLNHPNIATVHDFDTQDDADFLVEELMAYLWTSCWRAVLCRTKRSSISDRNWRKAWRLHMSTV